MDAFTKSIDDEKQSDTILAERTTEAKAYFDRVGILGRIPGFQSR